MKRIELIVTCFRKAIDRVRRARQLFMDGDRPAALTLLAETQLVVSSLASGHAGAADSLTANFLRLYEFVSHSLAQSTPTDLDAAEKTLSTLLEAFESIREQGVTMEVDGDIPALDREHVVQIMA